MDLEQVKNYLRIDGNYDDFTIGLQLQVATAYVLGAVDYPEVVSQDVRFEYAVVLLVGHWYENRLATSEQYLNAIPFGVEALVNQLRGLVPNETV